MELDKDTREKLINVKNSIANYAEFNKKGSIPTEEEIIKSTNMVCGLLFPNLTKEEINEVKKMLFQQFQFKLETGIMIYNEESKPWFKEFKQEGHNYYFDRYKEYLFNDKGFNREAIRRLDEDVLDDIMDYIGDPRLEYFEPKKGLIMGDVQSGKTSTYIGMICKAADAGYKAIIVLTGTVESLRVQTQKRLDLGFVGFDSSHMLNENQEDFWIGVGKHSRAKKGIVLTSAESDFLSKNAQNLGFSLNSFNDTVLFVVKKNTTVLSRLIKWLQDLNGKQDGKIDFPLLVIDDEADNASINTRDEGEDPSKINSLIRKLLNIFSRNNYVGFTATPFANIFINPDEKDNLFPKDFIYCLKSPETYIGANKLFNGGVYAKSLRINDDCKEVLPPNHKKYVPFEAIPSSLEDALLTYFISNVIRDLRGDNHEHRAMLVNISRFVVMHSKIQETIQNFYSNVLTKYALYCKESTLAMNDKMIRKTYDVWKSQAAADYSTLDIKWEEILPNLYESNKNIQIIIVNKDSSMINYDDYKENGARVIVIGGLSLSRGLTIEGLCVSYFFRYSKTYDVLLQMGRWFGYRRGYEDLFRIWIPTELKNWYASISEAVDELKEDLERMKLQDKKPIDFGLRIKNDKTKLKITANNKMRTAATTYETISLFGDFVDTPCIPKDIVSNANNIKVAEKFIEQIKNNEHSELSLNKRHLFTNVKKEKIVDFLKDFKLSKYNPNFDKDGIISFINNYDGNEFEEFDVVIVEGDRRNSDSTFKFANYDITPVGKQFDVMTDVLRINKSRLMLVNPYDIRDGILSEKLYNKIIDEDLKFFLEAHPDRRKSDYHAKAKTYLNTTQRNPLLLIYLIDLIVHDEYENAEQLCAIKEHYKEHNVFPIGIALGIPKYRDYINEKSCYKINVVEQRNLLKEEFEYEEDI